MIDRLFKDMPQRVTYLPRDARGYPVPKFVEWIDGKPDFRVIDPEHMLRCIRHKACWICGEPLGRYMVFVIGPMCVINRISAEPPSHMDCARFAAEACPFLSQPLAKRRERDLPAHAEVPGMLEHNPGTMCLWVTSSYKVVQNGKGLLFQIGEPMSVEFWSQGRKATRAEIDAAIEKGFPLLMEMAVEDGGDQPQKITQARFRAERLIDQWAGLDPA